MPQVFRVGAYIVYFWSDENDPLEPIHVHVAEGKPRKDGTKIWITKSGKTLIANNKSDIPLKDLRNIQRIIESNIDFVIQKWTKHFEGEIQFYC